MKCLICICILYVHLFCVILPLLTDSCILNYIEKNPPSFITFLSSTTDKVISRSAQISTRFTLSNVILLIKKMSKFYAFHIAIYILQGQYEKPLQMMQAHSASRYGLWEERRQAALWICELCYNVACCSYFAALPVPLKWIVFYGHLLFLLCKLWKTNY